MRRKLYDYVDEFIVTTCSRLGQEFRRADLQQWRDDQRLEFDVGDALSAHRRAPRHRVFTTERIGMGPNSYYRVIGTPEGIADPAVLRMHRQQATEMVSRWIAEYTNRMAPLSPHGKKARRYARQAEAEVKAVATLLHLRMSDFGEPDDALIRRKVYRSHTFG